MWDMSYLHLYLGIESRTLFQRRNPELWHPPKVSNDGLARPNAEKRRVSRFVKNGENPRFRWGGMSTTLRLRHNSCSFFCTPSTYLVFVVAAGTFYTVFAKIIHISKVHFYCQSRNCTSTICTSGYDKKLNMSKKSCTKYVHHLLGCIW
jgi:hypothetical protein